jgi:hypothetical protein
MSDKIFNFDDQLKIGNNGETDFMRIYEKLEPKKSLDNFRIDFLLNNGKTIELKTDNYDMNKTPNFFMEQYTVSGNKSDLGGPWRSKEHNVDYFVYYFIKNKVFFWFDPVSLCECLDKFIRENELKQISIPNVDKNGGCYKALGFKIPRDSLKSVLLKEHKI